MTQTQSRKKNLFQMNVDLMHGPIFRSLVLFMLPILISNLFQQLYNTVDTMIVGNVLGDTALAAIGSCGAIYELLVGFGLGIGNGLAIVAARAYGAQDEDLLKRTVTGSLVIGLAASLTITTAGFFGLRPLLELLDTPAEILEDAYRYIIIIDLGVIVMFAYNLCAGLLRAIGNSVMPLVFLLLSSALNVVLDLWFIAGMGMGVAGAAVATVIAQGVSVVLCILYVMARVRVLIPGRKHLDVGRKLYWDLFSQSISMGLMSSIVSAGSVILQYGINGLGTLTIAGHTAARKLFAFTDMPLIAMANAASTFVSQNYGAGEPERIRKAADGRTIAAILLTHGHFDHIGAVRALMTPETELVVHAQDAPMLSNPQENASFLMGAPVTAPEATRLVHEGDKVTAAGLTFTVLHTPGHTAGSVCYQIGDKLFTGDTLFRFGCGRTDLPTGSSEQMQASLARVVPMARNLEIYPGHGD